MSYSTPFMSTVCVNQSDSPILNAKVSFDFSLLSTIRNGTELLSIVITCLTPLIGTLSGIV